MVCSEGSAEKILEQDFTDASYFIFVLEFCLGHYGFYEEHYR